MIKGQFLVVCFLGSIIFYAPRSRAAPVPPASVADTTEPGLFFRLFKDFSAGTLMAETGGINESDGRNYREITIGGYHDIYPSLTVGAFYRRAYGLRHDDDWHSTNGNWSWADTNSRGEDFLILDVTPKLLVQGLPIEHIAAELKTRLLYNFFNGEDTLMLRPGLTFFWLKDEQPLVNVFLQYELDMPLNYGRRPIYERWLYLGALYRVARDVDIGGFFAEKWQTWGNSSDYADKGGEPFILTAKSDVLSALLIWHIQ